MLGNCRNFAVQYTVIDGQVVWKEAIIVWPIWQCENCKNEVSEQREAQKIQRSSSKLCTSVYCSLLHTIATKPV